MMRRTLLAVAALAALPTTAQAGAWTMPAGEGQAILTATHTSSDQGFDTDGSAVDIDDYNKSEAYLLIEYGVTDDLTVFAIPSLSRVRVENGGDNVSGLGVTELGARYRLTESSGTVVSLQGSARLHGERRRNPLDQADVSGNEYDARLQLGHGFGEGKGSGFVDLQAGYRFREGPPADEFRIDATIGYRPTDRLMLLAQSFNALSNGPGALGFGYRYHKLQASVVAAVSDRVSLQGGAVMTLAGEDALRERGLLAGVWLRFP